MRKLYRTALFAGVLAFGVAACGDDVQIVEPEPTPPPALSVTLTPANATATVGENAAFAVGISGGDASADASWTCASSNTGVASVSGTATGCQATALAAGNAQITVTVTKGNQSSNAGAQLTVNAVADEQAAVSIDRITQGGTTNPVNINNVAGQIDVTLNLEENDETATQVDVLVDGEVAASQVFTSAILAEMAAEAEAAGQEVQSITLSFNTGEYDVDEDAFTAMARYENGERVIGAQVHVEESQTARQAANTITVDFNNDNTFHVLADRTGIDTAMDPNGLLWYGGPDFEITVYPIPVMYDGEVVVSMTARLDNDNDLVCANQTDGEAPFGFTFGCVGVEAMGYIPVVQSTVTDAGNNGPMSGFGANLNIANVDNNNDHPFPMRIDVQAPKADGAIMIVRQSGLNNTGNWVNDEYNFMQSSAYTRPTDGGVGGVSEDLFIRDLDASATISPSDLEESVTNERYRLRVIAQDALGNSRTINQSGDGAYNNEDTFGYDVTMPTLAEFDDLGQFDGAENILEQLGTDDGVFVRTTDNLAGFHEDFAGMHALVTTRGQFNGEGALEAPIAIVGSSPVSTPFAAVASGANVASMAGIPLTINNFVTQTAFEFEVDGFPGLITAELGTPMVPARYYVYQFRVQDQAGNFVKRYRAVYVNNESMPQVQGLTNPSTFDAMTTFEASIARDSVELLEGSLEIRYPNTGGTLVWERPTADISSVLRMNAGLLDGELFNDVIYRPQNDVMFPLGFDALGLPFLKNIQTMDDGDTNAKPDSVRARVFNGFGSDDETLNHSAPAAGGSGFSALIRNAIIDEEVADATIVFNELHGSNWTFEIVDNTAVDCDADYCVRAVGPLSTFTNPFDGGPMFVVWADRETATGNGTGVKNELQWRVLATAEPNFSHPFPTRDSGNDRIYEWEFSLSGANTGPLQGDEVAFGAVGMNANTGDGLLTAQFMDPPPEVFNVVFDPDEDDLVNTNGETVTFDLEHGTNSTATSGDPVTVDAFDWVDAAGNVLIIPPTGLGLSCAGNTCTVQVTDDANTDLGVYFIRGTGSDGTDTDNAVATVNLVSPEFNVELTPDSTAVEVPATGTDTQVFALAAPSGGPISAMSCSIAPASTEVSVTEVGGDCQVTFSEDATPGNYTITADATEDGTGATASAEAILTIETYAVAVDPASDVDNPLFVFAPNDEVQILGVDVTGSRTNAMIVDASTTCTVVGGVAGVTTSLWNAATDECTVTVNDGAATPIGPFTVEVSVATDNGGDVRTDVITAYFDHLEAFSVVYDIDATDPNNRRDIERNRTANFVVDEAASDLAAGIDVAASSATVSPSSGGVTAAVVEDNGDILLQVTVPADANTGNYTVTTTWVEDGTGREVVVESYITVTDTGQIIIDDGAL